MQSKFEFTIRILSSYGKNLGEIFYHGIQFEKFRKTFRY